MLFKNAVNLRNVGTCFRSIIPTILFCACFGESYASAQSIQVESDTNIQAEQEIVNSGRFQACLFDDLNLGVIHKEIRAEIFDSASGDSRDFSATSDESGCAHFDPELPPGKYQVLLFFKGEGGYRGSEAVLNLIVQRCHANAKLDLPSRVWRRGMSIPLSILRESGTCANYPVTWNVHWNERSAVLTMKQNVLSAIVNADTDSISNNRLTFDVSLAESETFAPEHLTETVYLYHHFFEDDPIPEADFYTNRIRIRLNDSLKNAPSIGVQLRILRDDQNISHFIAQTDRNSAVFDVSHHTEGCFNAQFSRTDPGFEQDTRQYRLCMPHFFFNAARIRIIMLASTAIFILLFACLIIIRRFKLQKKLDSPQQWASKESSETADTVMEWPKETAASLVKNETADAPSIRFICVRDNENRTIPPSALKMSINGQPIIANAWPCTLNHPGKLVIEHPDCIPWIQTVKKCGKHIIRLRSRRNYVIACFNAVCENIAPSAKQWGFSTPDDLYKRVSEICNLGEMPRVNEFCLRVAKAAFDTKHINDEQMIAIHALGSAIIKENRRKISQVPKKRHVSAAGR